MSTSTRDQRKGSADSVSSGRWADCWSRKEANDGLALKLGLPAAGSTGEQLLPLPPPPLPPFPSSTPPEQPFADATRFGGAETKSDAGAVEKSNTDSLSTDQGQLAPSQTLAQTDLQILQGSRLPSALRRAVISPADLSPCVESPPRERPGGVAADQLQLRTQADLGCWVNRLTPSQQSPLDSDLQNQHIEGQLHRLSNTETQPAVPARALRPESPQTSDWPAIECKQTPVLHLARSSHADTSTWSGSSLETSVDPASCRIQAEPAALPPPKDLSHAEPPMAVTRAMARAKRAQGETARSEISSAQAARASGPDLDVDHDIVDQDIAEVSPRSRASAEDTLAAKRRTRRKIPRTTSPDRSILRSLDSSTATSVASPGAITAGGGRPTNDTVAMEVLPLGEHLSAPHSPACSPPGSPNGKDWDKEAVGRTSTEAATGEPTNPATDETTGTALISATVEENFILLALFIQTAVLSTSANLESRSLRLFRWAAAAVCSAVRVVWGDIKTVYATYVDVPGRIIIRFVLAIALQIHCLVTPLGLLLLRHIFALALLILIFAVLFQVAFALTFVAIQRTLGNPCHLPIISTVLCSRNASAYGLRTPTHPCDYPVIGLVCPSSHEQRRRAFSGLCYLPLASSFQPCMDPADLPPETKKSQKMGPPSKARAGAKNLHGPGENSEKAVPPRSLTTLLDQHSQLGSTFEAPAIELFPMAYTLAIAKIWIYTSMGTVEHSSSTTHQLHLKKEIIPAHQAFVDQVTVASEALTHSAVHMNSELVLLTANVETLIAYVTLSEEAEQHTQEWAKKLLAEEIEAQAEQTRRGNTMAGTLHRMVTFQWLFGDKADAALTPSARNRFHARVAARQEFQLQELYAKHVQHFDATEKDISTAISMLERTINELVQLHKNWEALQELKMRSTEYTIDLRDKARARITAWDAKIEAQRAQVEKEKDRWDQRRHERPLWRVGWDWATGDKGFNATKAAAAAALAAADYQPSSAHDLRDVTASQIQADRVAVHELNRNLHVLDEVRGFYTPAYEFCSEVLVRLRIIQSEVLKLKKDFTLDGLRWELGEIGKNVEVVDLDADFKGSGDPGSPDSESNNSDSPDEVAPNNQASHSSASSKPRSASSKARSELLSEHTKRLQKVLVAIRARIETVSQASKAEKQRKDKMEREGNFY